ncbi:MAG: YccF domain-containing protein [Lachnospiraceae bacterium]|nr:YccF domain-containing protein [Lachnospiraceae bacterium]
MIAGILLTLALLLFIVLFFFSAAGLLLRILYFVCIALPLSIVLGAAGILLCCTIIGIPLGLMCLRGAGSLFFSFL